MRFALFPLRFDPSRWVLALLGAALGLQLGWMLTGAFGARDRQAAPPPPMTVTPTETIKAARLFGTPEFPGTAAATAAPPPISTQGLTLIGVLAAVDPKAGQAIIGEAGGTARVYAVGGTLPGGARLAEVYADRVILDRGGSFETLPLPRQGGTPSALASTLPSAAVAAMAPALTADTAVDNITQVIRWQTVIRTDKPSGVRVYPAADAAMFTQLGLRPGDLVLAVNDSPLADQANGEQFLRSLAGTPQARLTVERNGRPETLLIDLTQLAAAR